MTPTDIPQFIKKLRLKMNLTQERVAREVGVSFATINAWENGKRKPQPFLMEKLREVSRRNPLNKLVTEAATAE